MSKRKSTEEFIKDAIIIHGDKYNYSKVEYVNNRTKVCIICPYHGEFLQKPNNHLNGQGCLRCRNVYLQSYFSLKSEEFMHRSSLVHNHKYDYSHVEFINEKTPVKILCPYHGVFLQRPDHHLNGYGCKQCGFIISGKKKCLDNETFIEKCVQIHGVKYNYSNINYINSQTKICIICSTHGEFWQRPSDHISGQGCPKCKCSYLEKEIRDFLSSEQVYFTEQYRCKWLGLQSLDFYLPDYNIAIECQGKQHFKAVEHFGGRGESLEVIQKRDQLKLQKCKDNGVKLLYYSNLGIDYPYKVFEKKEELLKEIKGDT